MLVGPEASGLGPDAVALPTEEALVLRVALPLASHRQRQAAAGFAVEDLIAEPLEAVHVVLGPEVGAGEYLAFVVGHAAMAARAGRANRAGGRLVPDVLALPVPAPGSVSVREALGRVLVRRSDGTGFATPTESFEPLWRADGTPQIVLYGGRLPDGIPVGATGLMPATPPAEALSVDLLQGEYVRDNRARRRLFGRIAAVLVLAAVAHGLIFAADTLALQRIDGDRQAALRGALAARVPGVTEATPIDAALRRAMPAAEQPGAFLPLLARASEALAPVGDRISLDSLAFSAADGTLSLSVEAPDLETLQAVEASLVQAGLAVSSGVATTDGGKAEARYVIGGGQ